MQKSRVIERGREAKKHGDIARTKVEQNGLALRRIHGSKDFTCNESLSDKQSMASQFNPVAAFFVVSIVAVSILFPRRRDSMVIFFTLLNGEIIIIIIIISTIVLNNLWENNYYYWLLKFKAKIKLKFNWLKLF